MVTDGYSAYQKIDKENPDITFAGCCAHCRRKFSDVLKGLKGKQKENAKITVAYQALQQIAAIYHLNNSYSELQPEERLKMRQLTDPFRYMKYLLTELMKHLDDTDRSFLDDLLPWSKTLPDICRSNQQK